MGRPPSQKKEAIRRRSQGATLRELADSYDRSISTMCRATRTAWPNQRREQCRYRVFLKSSPGLIAPLADLVTQTNSSATAGASGSFIDEFNPGGLQRCHDFRQTLDYSPNDTIARFHPLDCRKRDPGGLGQRLLFHPGQSPCRSHLCRGQQIRPPSKRLSG